MTSLNYLTLIDELKKRALFETTDTYIIGEGDKRRFCMIGNWDSYISVYCLGCDFERGVEKFVAGIITELCPDFDPYGDNFSVTHGWNSYRIEIDLRAIAFPGSDQSDSEDKCPGCGSTL
jgi:hypothetical protein